MEKITTTQYGSTQWVEKCGEITLNSSGTQYSSDEDTLSEEEQSSESHKPEKHTDPKLVGIWFDYMCCT